MKAYIVRNYITGGIESVFSDRKRAELYCADHGHEDIEECEVDREDVKAGEVYYGIEGFFYMGEMLVMDTWQRYSRESVAEYIERDKRGLTIILPVDRVYTDVERRKMLNEYRARLRERDGVDATEN